MSFTTSAVRLCLLSMFLKVAIAVDEVDFFTDNYLYEGSSCDLKGSNNKGQCVTLLQCPPRLEDAKKGLRQGIPNDRCGFKDMLELVCCPLNHIDRRGGDTNGPNNTPTKLLRPADAACEKLRGRTKIISYIANGSPAESGEFPYIAALGFKRKDDPSKLEYSCGGALIDELHVLTAAHCIRNARGETPVQVKVGAINLQNGGDLEQNIEIKKYTRHPSYKRSLKYFDIAVIELKKPVNFSDTVKPACLQTLPLSKSTSANLNAVVAGWGLIEFVSDEGSDDLLKSASLSMVGTDECRRFYPISDKMPHGLDEGMLCFVDRNLSRSSDACDGDSGGPLTIKTYDIDTVVGITSFGHGCGAKGVPGIYTSVYHYLDWIESIVWPQEKSSSK